MKVLNTNLPDLKLELTDENHKKLLLDYRTDIAFSRDKIIHGNIDSLKLYTEPICLVVPNNYWIYEKSLNSITDLQNEKFIISGLHQTTFFASLLRTLFVKYEFEPKTTIESDFGGMILNLVSKEIGISILPRSFKSAKVKNLQFIKLNKK